MPTYYGGKTPNKRVALNKNEIMKAVKAVLKKEYDDEDRYSSPDKETLNDRKEREKGLRKKMDSLSKNPSVEEITSALSNVKMKDIVGRGESAFFTKGELKDVEKKIGQAEVKKTLDYQKARERAMTPDMFAVGGSGG